MAAGINPIAKQFEVSHQKAGYLTTTYTLFSGITPLLITPYVNLYGRRPAYLVCSIATTLPLFGADYKSSVVFNHGRHRQQYRICVFYLVWRGDRLPHFRGRRLSRSGNRRCHSLFPSFPHVTIIPIADQKNNRFVICSSKESVDALWASMHWQSPTVYVYLFPIRGRLLTDDRSIASFWSHRWWLYRVERLAMDLQAQRHIASSHTRALHLHLSRNALLARGVQQFEQALFLVQDGLPGQSG